MTTAATGVATLEGTYLPQGDSHQGRRAALSVSERFVMLRRGDADLAWDRRSFDSARADRFGDQQLVTFAGSEGSGRESGGFAGPGAGSHSSIPAWAAPNNLFGEGANERWANSGFPALRRYVAVGLMIMAAIIGVLGGIAVLLSTFESDDFGVISGGERIVRFITGTAFVAYLVGYLAGLALIVRLGAVVRERLQGTRMWTGFPFANGDHAVDWGWRLPRLFALFAIVTAALGTMVSLHAGAVVADLQTALAGDTSFNWGAFLTLWIASLSVALVNFGMSSALGSSADAAGLASGAARSA